MNRNKICLNLKAGINYICKTFNHSLIQSFIPFLEFPECPHCWMVIGPYCYRIYQFIRNADTLIHCNTDTPQH